MFRNIETIDYLCIDNYHLDMAINNLKVKYMDEALTFIESLPRSAGDKITPKKEIAKAEKIRKEYFNIK